MYTPFQIRKIIKLNTHALKTDDLLTCVVIFSPHKASNLTSLTLLWLTYFGSHLEAMTPEIHAYSPRLKIKRMQTAWRPSSSRRRQSVCRYLCLCRACTKIKQARMTGKRLTRVLTVHLIFLWKKRVCFILLSEVCTIDAGRPSANADPDTDCDSTFSTQVCRIFSNIMQTDFFVSILTLRMPSILSFLLFYFLLC